MLMKTNKPPKPRRSRQAEAAEQPTQPPGRNELSESEAAALYRLMTWLSPSFPVGAFSYSSGIEWAVEAGDITDAASLRQWLRSMLVDGAGICDSTFLAHTHRAAAANDDATLREIAELASAFAPSRERHLETTAQGRAFIEIARAAWHHAALDRLIAACEGKFRLSGCGRRRQRRALHSARADASRFPPRGRLELDIRRSAPGPARPNR
jgi:urease accessory protein